MSDRVVPGFRNRSLKGETFFNPMYSATCSIDGGSGSTPVGENKTFTCSSPNAYKGMHRYTQDSSSVGRVVSGFSFPIAGNGMLIPPTSIVSEQEVSRARGEAVTSMLNSRGRASNNLFETSAELHKSFGLVNAILGNVVKTLNRNKSLLQRAKSSGSAYLAYRYGLKPLMNDLEAVKKGMLSEVGKTRSTSRGFSQASNSSSASTATHYAGLDAFYRVISVNEDYTFRAMSLDEYTATFFSNIGFTAKGLVTLPWELLPYSFVADWFVNFGDFIGSLVPTVGYNQLGSCLVETRHITEVVTAQHYGDYNSGISVVTPISGSCTRTWDIKSRVLGPFAPTLVIRNNFGFERATRVGDAIALIVQKLR